MLLHGRRGPAEQKIVPLELIERRVVSEEVRGALARREARVREPDRLGREAPNVPRQTRVVALRALAEQLRGEHDAPRRAGIRRLGSAVVQRAFDGHAKHDLARFDVPRREQTASSIADTHARRAHVSALVRHPRRERLHIRGDIRTRRRDSRRRRAPAAVRAQQGDPRGSRVRRGGARHRSVAGR
jgi:hypothetical protein